MVNFVTHCIGQKTTFSLPKFVTYLSFDKILNPPHTFIGSTLRGLLVLFVNKSFTCDITDQNLSPKQTIHQILRVLITRCQCKTINSSNRYCSFRTNVFHLWRHAGKIQQKIPSPKNALKMITFKVRLDYTFALVFNYRHFQKRKFLVKPKK